MLLGYKPVQHVTVLNTVGNCNTIVSIIILYYNIMGPPSYMRSVVDRNVVMRRIYVVVVIIIIIIIIIHMPKPVYEDGDVTVLWNQAVHRQRSYSK